MSEASAGEPRVKVLYVGGTGRSGSTVLANVLGQLPGCISVGEVRFIWERGMIQDRLCGCGVTFSTCPFWQKVLDRAFADKRPDPARMIELQARTTRLRSLPVLLRTRRSPERRRAGLDELPVGLEHLYAAIAEVSGATVVVDSSKLPSYAALLEGLARVQVRALHLVRDPRAAAFSWRRRKALTDRSGPAFMERRGVLKSVWLWVVWNRALEALWRSRPQDYQRVTYEQFVADPRAVVDSIAQPLDIHYNPDALFPTPGTVRLDASHTVAGNPARLQHGPIALTLDDEWTRSMPRRDQNLVRLLATATMRRYGY